MLSASKFNYFNRPGNRKHMQTFFQGLKVVELASVLAGPAVGMFFAELGAEVVKIENARTGGDVTRQWKLPSEDRSAPDSAYYQCVNWGKKIRLLDLQEEEARREVHALISQADIVISNFRPESARRLQMDEATLRELNPRLIFAQLTGFGPHEADRPAFDVILQAESGFLYMTGEPGRPPVKMPVALIDLLAAHQLKEAILIALLRRYQTGEGSSVTTSLFESAVASLANQATNWLMAGHIPGPMGSRHPNIAPYGDIFYTRDNKPVVIGTGTERQFRCLCECLDLPQLPDEERFSGNRTRLQHREALCEALAPAFRKWDRDQLLVRLHQFGVPAGAVRTMPEVFELPDAQAMILEDVAAGRIGRRVKSIAFREILKKGGRKIQDATK